MRISSLATASQADAERACQAHDVRMIINFSNIKGRLLTKKRLRFFGALQKLWNCADFWRDHHNIAVVGCRPHESKPSRLFIYRWKWGQRYTKIRFLWLPVWDYIVILPAESPTTERVTTSSPTSSLWIIVESALIQQYFWVFARGQRSIEIHVQLGGWGSRELSWGCCDEFKGIVCILKIRPGTTKAALRPAATKS